MNEIGKPTKLKDPHRLDLDLPPPIEAASAPLDGTRTSVDAFIARREEVAKSDHEEFQEYLREKQVHALAVRAEAAPSQETAPPKVTRRGVLKVVAGTAIVGESAALGYNAVQSGALSTFGALGAGSTQSPGNAVVAEAQRHPISRELIDSKGDVGGRSLGKWIALLPTKLGGGCYALDLNTNRVLASVWYWNYGDYNPIAHHLCAFPSADPYNGFEFINSTQGGKNCLIYGIPTNITEPAPGFNIYRVRYDGAQMQVMENVSEATGLGLGVHVTVNPKDAQSYFVTDGQKDIAACFDRTTSQVKAALKFDWKANSHDLSRAWQDGGVLKISSRSGDRKIRLSRHQGSEDRVGNGADGRALRRGRYLAGR
jgi:hypothetical protein